MTKFYSLALGAMCAAIALSAEASSGIGNAERLVMSRPTPLRITNQCCSSTQEITVRQGAVSRGDTIQWSEWQTAGTGTFVLDSGFADFTGLTEYQGEFPGIGVERRHNLADTTMVQVKLLGVYNNADLVMDLDTKTNALRVSPQPTNLLYFDSTPIDVLDAATGFELYGEEWAGLTGDDLQAIVDMYAGYNYYVPELGRYYVYLGYTTEGVTDFIAIGDMQFQLDGMGDASVKVEAADFIADPANLKFGLEFDPVTVASCRYVVTKGVVCQASLDKVLEGDPAVESVTDPGEYAFAVENGINTYTIIAVSYAADGTPLEWGYATFSYTPEQSEQWEAVGQGTYTSDMFESVLGLQPVTYEVAVERNKANTSVYRIVNPYGTAYPYNSEFDYAADYNHYIVFDCSDPERVSFGFANLGLQLNGCGWFTTFTVGDYYELTQYTGAPGEYGRLDDKTITFASKSILMTAANIEAIGGENGAAYYSNISGELKLQLPSSVGIDRIEDGVEMSAPIYYNLQGVRIESPAKGQMVIEQLGDTVTKKIIE